MILANSAVAERISEVFPRDAIVRHHPPPLPEKLDELQCQLSELVGENVCLSSLNDLRHQLQVSCCCCCWWWWCWGVMYACVSFCRVYEHACGAYLLLCVCVRTYAMINSNCCSHCSFIVTFVCDLEYYFCSCNV